MNESFVGMKLVSWIVGTEAVHLECLLHCQYITKEVCLAHECLVNLPFLRSIILTPRSNSSNSSGSTSFAAMEVYYLFIPDICFSNDGYLQFRCLAQVL